jgi:hypothetical protein
VDSFMAARAPASATTQEGGVIHFANDDNSRRGLLLEMALQAEVRIPLPEQFGIH